VDEKFYRLKFLQLYIKDIFKNIKRIAAKPVLIIFGTMLQGIIDNILGEI